MIAARRLAAAYALFGMLLTIPLSSTPVLPLIDLYNHMARFYVLSRLDLPEFAGNYIPDWRLLPNLGADLLGVPLMHVLPALLTAKVLVGLVLLVQFSGLIFLATGINRRSLPLVLPFSAMLCYSYILGWGFVNFLLGVGVMLWTLGFWVRLRAQPLKAILICAPGAALIFLCHGFALLIYGLIASMIELGFWWQDRRRPLDLWKGWAALAAQAVLPVALFLTTPTAGAEGTSMVSNIRAYVGNGQFSERVSLEAAYRLKTIYRVAESPWPLFDVATFLVLLATIIIALRRRWWRLDRRLLPAIILLGIGAVAIPTNFFSASYLSERMALMFALVAVAGLSVTGGQGRGPVAAVSVIWVVAIVRLLATGWGWAAYAPAFAQYEKMIQAVPSGALAADFIIRDLDRRDSVMPRCQMYLPLLVPLRHAVAPIFAIPGQQPVKLGGALEKAIEQISPGKEAPRMAPARYADDLRRVAGSSFDYVLICGANRFTGPVPPNLRLLGEGQNIRLYRIEGPDPRG